MLSGEKSRGSGNFAVMATDSCTAEIPLSCAALHAVSTADREQCSRTLESCSPWIAVVQASVEWVPIETLRMTLKSSVSRLPRQHPVHLREGRAPSLEEHERELHVTEISFIREGQRLGAPLLPPRRETSGQRQGRATASMVRVLRRHQRLCRHTRPSEQCGVPRHQFRTPHRERARPLQAWPFEQAAQPRAQTAPGPCSVRRSRPDCSHRPLRRVLRASGRNGAMPHLARAVVAVLTLL